MHKDFVKTHPQAYTNWYQSACRIYLDEYPEQKKLRKDWFFLYHQIQIIKLVGRPITLEKPLPNILSLIPRLEIPIQKCYQHFYNRFLRRQ